MNELDEVAQGLQETVAFMTALLESVGEAVIACDADGQLTLFNRAARRLHSASESPVGPDEWAGRYDLYRADGTTPLPVEEIPLNRALGGEHVQNAEMVVAPSGRPPRTMLVNGSPIVDAAGRHHGAVVSMRDVTAAREAEQALRESRRHLRALIEHAPEAICVFNMDAERLVTVNAEAERLFGMERDRLLSSAPADLSPPLQPDGTPSEDLGATMIARALGGGAPHFEWTILTASGGTVPCEARLLRLPGERTLIRASLIDITRRRETEAALRAIAVEQAARRIAEEAGEHLAAVLEQMPAGVMITDAAGALVTGNGRVAEILGRPVPVGAVPGEVFDGVALASTGTTIGSADWPIARALATGDVVAHEEIVLAPPVGARKTILASAAPIRDGSGTVVAGVVTLQDVTARAAAGERLRHLQEFGAALSGAVSPVAVAEVAVAHAMAASGATRAWVARVDRPNRVLELLHQAGFASDVSDRLAHLPHTAPLQLAEVVRHGEALWLDGGADQSTCDPDLVALCPGADAVAVLPLVIDDAGIGCLTLGFSERHPFDRDVRLMLLTVAGLCAEALERAGRWEQERDAARLLQRSLLPAALPVDPQFALATRYLPAAGTLAGGDFYDAVALGDGRLALVVGDVVGHGIAAAAIMGQLRSAWRSIALDDRGTIETLERLSRFAATVPLAEVATAVCAVVAPDGQVSYACAGHPPPLRTGGPQGPMYLMDGRGPPLATGVDRYLEGQAMLAPGESLVFYTDGVIDRRGTSLEDGMANLVRAVAERGGSHDGALLDHLVDRLCQAPQDDCAFLAVRRRDQPRTG